MWAPHSFCLSCQVLSVYECLDRTVPPFLAHTLNAWRSTDDPSGKREPCCIWAFMCLYILFVCMCMWASLRVWVPFVLRRPEEGVIFHRTRATGIGTCLMWVLGPLKEQQVSLITEPSLVLFDLGLYKAGICFRCWGKSSQEDTLALSWLFSATFRCLLWKSDKKKEACRCYWECIWGRTHNCQCLSLW